MELPRNGIIERNPLAVQLLAWDIVMHIMKVLCMHCHYVGFTGGLRFAGIPVFLIKCKL